MGELRELTDPPTPVDAVDSATIIHRDARRSSLKVGAMLCSIADVYDAMCSRHISKRSPATGFSRC